MVAHGHLRGRPSAREPESVHGHIAACNSPPVRGQRCIDRANDVDRDLNAHATRRSRQGGEAPCARVILG